MSFREQLVEKVRSAGVVGAGGAGFPTHVKIDSRVEIVIANGTECEPLLCTDRRAMEQEAEGIIAGLKLVMEATGASRGIVAIKAHHQKAVQALEKALAREKSVSLHKMGNYYPAGDEHILVFDATGRIIPEGGIPLHVGVLVNNVNTLLNVLDASEGRPVTRQRVTVCGEVNIPRVFRVPIGVSFADLIQLCAGAKIAEYSILVGGPMMGRMTEDADEVVTKTTTGVVVLPKDHSYVMRRRRAVQTEIRMSKSICEQCRYCTDFCPRWLQGHGLEPHKIMRVMDYDRDMETDTITRAYLCCECGVCDLYACPMALSPRVIFREFKRRLAEAGIKNPHSRGELAARPYREYRKIPKDRLTRRLGLERYDAHPEADEREFSFAQVKIPLRQHVGVSAVPQVQKGDKVKKDQAIGDIPQGKLGARIHASMDGRVKEVTEDFVVIESV